MIVAGSTSAIAYLLDPAIKKIFIEKDQTLIIIIPILIILALVIQFLIYVINQKPLTTNFSQKKALRRVLFSSKKINSYWNATLDKLM